MSTHSTHGLHLAAIVLEVVYLLAQLMAAWAGIIYTLPDRVTNKSVLAVSYL